MHRKQIKFLILIVAIALAVNLIFFISCFKLPLSGDALQYDAIAWNLAQGNGYSLSEAAPYEPTMLREPAYPIFLCLIYKAFGHRIHAVYIVQILLFLCSCILVFAIASKLFNNKIARYSSLFVVICPTLANFNVLLYTESFFFSLLMLTVYWLIKTKDNLRSSSFFVGGVLLGLLALCRGAMVLLFVPFIVWLYMSFGSADFFRRCFLKLFVLMIALSFMTAPWLMRNSRVFGVCGFNSIGSRALLARVHRSDYSLKQTLQSTVYYFSEYIGAKLFPEAFDTPNECMLIEGRRIIKRERQLLDEGYSIIEINDIFKSEASAKIKDHPVKFLTRTPFELVRLMHFMYIPALNQTVIVSKFKEFNGGSLILSLVRGIYKITVYPLIIFSALGVYFVSRTRRKELLFLILLILYVNCIYSVFSGYPRYNIPLIPFYLMFAAVGIVRLFKLQGDK